MRKLSSLLVICGVLVAAVFFAKSARADDAKTEPAKVEADAKASEFLVFDKAKLGAVKFAHAKHAEKVGGCDTCHGGKEPIFHQKKTELKMADMYAGKSCGACHDGKEHYEVKVFAVKGSCMKCHKKEAK